MAKVVQLDGYRRGGAQPGPRSPITLDHRPNSVSLEACGLKLRLTPDMARRLALLLEQHADEAEGPHG